MGITCSRNNRRKCCMEVEAIVSVILFLSSMYMFFLVGYYTSYRRKGLSLVFGVIGSLFLLSGIITTSYAVCIWRDLRKEDAQTFENSTRRVRFLSEVEFHGESDLNTGEEKNVNPSHEYEEMTPRSISGGKRVDKEQNLGEKLHKEQPQLPSNSEQDNIQFPPFSELFQLSTESDQRCNQELQNNDQNIFLKKYKMYIDSGSTYGTFKGSSSTFSEDSIEEFVRDDGEDIII